MGKGKHRSNGDGIGIFRVLEKTVDDHPRITLAFVLMLVVSFGFIHGGWFDNDQWFILANGRYITEHGFPYQDPFHYWGGNTVIENWLWSVIMWGAWHLTGDSQWGIWAVSTMVACMGASAAWCISKAVTRKNCSMVSATSALLTGAFLISAYSMRPSILSVTLAMISLYVFLDYLNRRDYRTLIVIPILMMIAFNMHMAMGWYVILIPGCFMLADVLITKGARLKRLGLYAAVTIASLLSTLVNPYFINGVTFLFKSYGEVKYRNYTIELIPLTSCTDSVECIVTMLNILLPATISLTLFTASILVLLLSKKTDETRRKLYMVALVFLEMGLLVTTLSSVRAAADFIYMVPLFVPIIMDRMPQSILKTLCVLVAVATLGVSVFGARSIAGYTPATIDNMYFRISSLSRTADYIESVASNKDTAIESDGSLGTWLVYRGYRVTNDMRPEMYSQPITGLDHDPHKEIVDANFDKPHARKYVERYKGRFRIWAHYKNSPVNKVVSKDKDFKLLKKIDNYYVYEDTTFEKSNGITEQEYLATHDQKR